ncbi:MULTISPECIES: hypothetical protein [Bradyrhizobium]|uniref:hypothetical protein n=1 Tax=Bradyrhizobium TaxID=374 RepID=UPI000577032B|nr:hypothetical protein [Bradyrhizobium sp. CCBAU 15544]
MTALQMQLELKRLALRHGATETASHIHPLQPATDHDLIFVGLAATSDIDQARMRFRPWCFSFLPWQKLPPLLFRHSEPAGELLEMSHDDRGNLAVRARVSHSLAKRCSHFSVAATVQEWELRDINDPANFHGLIKCCAIDEISITDRPCNTEAKVLYRYRPSPAVELYDIAKQGVICITKIITLMASMPVAPVALPPPTKPRHATRPRHAPAHIISRRPKSQFTALAEELNSRAG